MLVSYRVSSRRLLSMPEGMLNWPVFCQACKTSRPRSRVEGSNDTPVMCTIVVSAHRQLKKSNFGSVGQTSAEISYETEYTN